MSLLCVCFSSDAEFSLSLNGSEPLSDSGQTLSSCGIVSGDLICVMLPESLSAAVFDQQASRSSEGQKTQNQTEHTADMTSNQVGAAFIRLKWFGYYLVDKKCKEKCNKVTYLHSFV